MRIILIGNYLPDRQQSMQRFALMMQEGLAEAGISVTIWHPTVLFGRAVGDTRSGVGKWIGYLDKWIVFPLVLWWRIRRLARQNEDYQVHICDHSNAPYLKWLPRQRTVITCHDVLAIQSARKIGNTNIPISRVGVFYQAWILKHLVSAQRLAAVSQYTMNALLALANDNAPAERTWRVIHNAFNAPFSPVTPEQATSLLTPYDLSAERPFILHVGSSEPRKNRPMLLSMVAELGDAWNGLICFAGHPLEETIQQQAEALHLTERIVSIVYPDHATLLALYSSCQAFIFPSFSEGFGWPVIEAQACGAPVIASSTDPIPEVSGGAALLADPTLPKTFANALLSLTNNDLRADLIQRGFVNSTRFEKKAMIEACLTLYRST